VDVNERTTRWIIGSMATALWVTTALTARIGVTMHWYLAIWLATALASCGVLLCVADALARARDAKRDAMRRVPSDGIQVICEAIELHASKMSTLVDRHATRMETATEGHGNQLRADVFNAERWQANLWRGQTLGQYDAAMEAARRAGNDTGPLPRITAGPR
jgi:hypothetical protein